MPNEQCAGNPHYNSDIYAIGMTGIQALTGLPPSQLKQDPRSGEILWVYRTQGTQVSHALAAILSQMVRYKFTERYQTVNEVLQALQELTIQPSVPSVIDAISAPLPEGEIPLAFPVDLDTSAAEDDSETAIASSTRPWPEAFGSSSQPPSQTFSAEPSTTPTPNS
jgi:serine/threonine protein kinase